MKMYSNIWIICMIISVKYVSCQTFELRNSSQACTLASPAITFSNDGNYIDLPVAITNAIEADNGIVQVGYLRTFRVFQYIGCIRDRDMPSGKALESSDPGQCYSFCRSTYFAIYNDDCYCLPDTHNLDGRSKECDIRCSFPCNTACGGRDDGRRYVSLYKYVPSASRSGFDGHFCRAYNKLTRAYTWFDCSLRLPGFCRGKVTTGAKTWIDYSRECFDDYKVPADENNTSIGTQNEPFMWIGRIKSWVVESNKAADKEDALPNYKGFVKWDSERNRLALSFARSEELEGSKLLCFPGTPTTTEATSTNAVPVQTTMTSVSTTTIPMGTTPAGDPNTQSPLHKITNQQECKVLVAVYVVVPLCVIVCAVVLILFILNRRRYKEAMNEPQYNEHKGSARPDKKVNTSAVNKAYERDFDPGLENVGEHGYFELEPANSYSEIDNKLTIGAIEKPQAVVEDEYDTTSMSTLNKVHKRGNDDNVYNKLDEENDDVYDHSTGGDFGHNKQTGLRVDEETYNHVGKVDNDNDDSYNTLNGVTGQNKMKYNSDNVYSHARR